MQPSAGDWRGLTRGELPADTILLARFLIGRILVRETPAGRQSGRIVETEAYPPGDAAGHGFRGETPANRVLFLERGHAHVYLAYGTSWMCNVSSETAGVGAGVLFRALEPLEGIPAMQERRGVQALRDLARGPGRLAAALDIDRRLDGVDLCQRGLLWLAQDDHDLPDIGVSTRIGLSRETERPLRFYVRGDPFVSGPRSLSTGPPEIGSSAG
jgi:DNA-3-methyladenine glycosylase